MRALTRDVSDSIGRCELTHLARSPIDVARARAQHRAYEQALESYGLPVERLPSDPAWPDAVFIEDTAVVLPELAVICRPGARSRRPEVAGVEAALARFRPIVRIDPPATIDGGDVLVMGRSVFVGRSSRTSDEAVRQLRSALEPAGYRVVAVAVSGCLHLKSAATSLDAARVLIDPRRVSPLAFAGFECVEVDADEPGAANVVSVPGGLLAGAAYPRTCDRLEAMGWQVARVDAGELAKAEGALTCCSLLVS
jgi:dimethylargininase